MTNREFFHLLSIGKSVKAMRGYASRNFPSRRAAKSTSHGDMRIQEKKMRIIPGVRIER